MLEQEKIRQYYNLKDEFAPEWTEPKAYTELDYGKAGKTSKYALLRQLVSSSSTSSNIPLPQDEPDPLGSTNSVVSVLKARHIDIRDPNKRSKYLVSSTKFNPRVFLRDVHPDATYENLVNSLSYLESTISERSEALRFLVEHDYDRFVRSKSSLDSVFKNIQGAGFNEINHWGVAHLQSLIDDANAKGTVIMKPVLDNKSKHDRLKTALSLIERNKYLFNLPSAILHHVKINDHDSLVRDFRRGRDIRYSEENQLVDPNAKEVLDLEKVTDRIWGQVKNIVEDYKKQEWKKLANITADQNYLGVISKLLELGCEDNPIHEWISSQIGLFETEARAAFEKLKSTTDVNRINILAVPQNRSAPLISALREIEKASEQPDILLDNFSVIEMWITIKVVTEDIANLMTRFCQFWQCCQGFLEGTLQANLPKGWHNESVPHLSFSPNEVQEIQKQGRGIADLIANETNQFFSSMSMLPLTENINSTSQLLNVSAKKPSRRKSSIMSNSAPTEIEVPSFLPPNSNALSATKYLPSLIFQLASGFNDFARLRLSSKTEEHLQEVLSVIREKSINAVLYAWAQDSTYLCLAENWTLSPNNRHLTKIPSLIRTYEVQVIQGLSSIMYITYNNQTLEDGQDIIPPVTSKLLSKVLSSFSGSISSGLDGIMKLVLPAENSHHRRSVSGSSILSQSGSSITASETNNLLPDSLSPDKKTLLTISNLNEIRDVIMPYLFKFYERSFNLSSRESANALRKSIDTMDNTLFELYTRRKKTILADLLRTGILKAGIHWTADEPHPRAVSSYIYDCLLTLVVTHSNVLSIAPEQVTRVISVLYDHIVKTLLSCYREIEQFGKYGLLQAIADIGFIRITLEKFQTPDMLNTYRLIYDTVKETTVEKELWDTTNPPWEQIHGVVVEAQASSKVRLLFLLLLHFFLFANIFLFSHYRWILDVLIAELQINLSMFEWNYIRVTILIHKDFRKTSFQIFVLP